MTPTGLQEKPLAVWHGRRVEAKSQAVHWARTVYYVDMLLCHYQPGTPASDIGDFGEGRLHDHVMGNVWKKLFGSELKIGICWEETVLP